MCNFLNDEWMETGNSFDSLKEGIKKMEEATEIKEVPMNDIYFLSVSDLGTGYCAIPLHADECFKKTKASLSLRKYPIDMDSYIKAGYDGEIVTSAFQNGLFMIESNKKLSTAKIKKMIENGSYVPVSEKAMSTISNRISHFGFGFFSERLIRDLSISSKFDKPIPVSVISRKDPDSGLKKVFAVMSQKYAAIPQEVLIKMVNHLLEKETSLGEALCSSWSISHSVTRVYIEFPEKEKEFTELYELPEPMIPGIMLETSDIGDCALRMRGYFRFETNNFVNYMEEEYARIHSGTFDFSELIDAVKTSIFPKYCTYPEHLAKLMTIDITTEEMSPADKLKAITKVYRKMSKEIGLVKAIGKNREKNLISQMIDSYDLESSTLNYTAYDVAMDFLSLPSRIESANGSVVEAISKLAPRVMTFKFEEKEEELLLV